MTQPRRMPADATGREGFCEPGGLMAAMADDMERDILTVATEDVTRVETLLKQPGLRTDELTRALGYLAQSAKAAINVAECRGERLERYEDEEASTA